MKKRNLYFIFMLLLILFVIVPKPAMAKGIFEHQDTNVPENQTVNDVVVIGGDAIISGTVKDAVIVFNGNVDVRSTAQIMGLVLVIGGHLHQETGAKITDEVINISFDDVTKDSLMIGGGIVVGVWLLQLASTVMFILLSTLTVHLSKDRIKPFVEYARRSPGRMIYIGFFSSLILIAITVLLLVTIIGIPFAVMIFLLIVASFILGLTVISQLVGERIQTSFGQSRWLVTLIGALVVVSAMNIPFVGGLLLFGILWFSIGIMTVWILGKIKRNPSA